MTSYISVIKEVIAKLEDSHIPYIIVGSIASMVYGEPRITRDIDLVLDIKSDDTLRFEKLFTQPEFYCPPIEILADEIRNRGQFNLLHVSSGLKIDIMVKKRTEFDDLRFGRIKRLQLFENLTANLASPEDIIIKKLVFYQEGGSEKHLRDIRGILSNTEVNKSYIENWIEKLNLKKEWDQI